MNRLFRLVLVESTTETNQVSLGLNPQRDQSSRRIEDLATQLFTQDVF